MKIRIYTLIVFFVVFAGCEKVIDVDLNNANPVIVIEANLFDNEGTFVVNVSKTGSYFEGFTKEMVSGAQVILSNDNGMQEVLSEIAAGVYSTSEIMLAYKTEYKLKVISEGETYEAVSYLHPPVKIEHIHSEYDEGYAFNPPGYSIICNFHDPKEIENYYRVRIYRNGKLLDGAGDYFLFTDRLFDGNNIEFLLRRRIFSKGDSATLDLMSIDKNAFDYFSTLSDIIGDSYNQSAAPANPISNFSNGALGYFSAYSFDSGTVVIE